MSDATPRICMVGFELPLDDVDHIELSEARTLSDYDVVVFSPSFVYHSARFYDGLPLVDQNEASTLHKQYAHWQSEIDTAARLGKTIIVLLARPRSYYFHTGEKQWSGTGKNARATNLVSEGNTYGCLKDIPITPVAVDGRRLVLSHHAHSFPTLCTLFVEQNSYQAVSNQVSNPILALPDASGRAGAFVSRSFSNLLVFPMLDDEDWTEVRDEDGNTASYWSDKAVAVAERFHAGVLEAHRAVKAGSGETKPQWVLDAQFHSLRQSERAAAIEGLREQRENIELQLAHLQGEHAEDDQWLALLYAGGTALERQVRVAMNLLGFSAVEYHDDTHQFDAVVEGDGERYIGECEGKDNKAVDIGKLSQLERCVAEDLAIRDADEFARAILFGNAHRLHPVEGRGAPFTERVLKAASQRGIRLISTVDLFWATLRIRNGADDGFKQRCRQAVHLSTGGIVQFPTDP